MEKVRNTLKTLDPRGFLPTTRKPTILATAIMTTHTFLLILLAVLRLAACSFPEEPGPLISTPAEVARRYPVFLGRAHRSYMRQEPLYIQTVLKVNRTLYIGASNCFKYEWCCLYYYYLYYYYCLYYCYYHYLYYYCFYYYFCYYYCYLYYYYYYCYLYYYHCHYLYYYYYFCYYYYYLYYYYCFYYYLYYCYYHYICYYYYYCYYYFLYY
ncbi:hypothetical protein QTP70_009743 [Hemibagrus guttatus]|uniref:Uncharacterized protein n=1 Tax=Hemibagrus guttatus TaxID=175788 RepID=A0AAE0Q3U5_9TELE|nr:hypothetical protein QTP70_009743 [Hemibagrus guttatus]